MKLTFGDFILKAELPYMAFPNRDLLELSRPPPASCLGFFLCLLSPVFLSVLKKGLYQLAVKVFLENTGIVHEFGIWFAK